MTGLTQINATIRQIDRNSDGICRELLRRTRVNIFDAGSWQLAWDRNPDLWARRETLHQPRWEAMGRRDELLRKEQRATERRSRAAIRKTVLKRCDACGEFSRIAA